MQQGLLKNTTRPDKENNKACESMQQGHVKEYSREEIVKEYRKGLLKNVAKQF